MSRYLFISCFVMTLLISPTVGTLFDGVSYAQDEAAQKPKRKTRKTPAMREKVYKRFSEAQIAAEEERYDDAIKILDSVEKRGKLNSYETAQMWNFYAFIAYSREDYPGAIRAYTNILKQEDLPEAMETGTLYSLAQLHFATEDYANAIVTLNKWFKVTSNPNPQSYVLLGQAYYSQQQYKKALGPVKKAIELAAAKGKGAKEQWWLLLRVIYFELEDYQSVAEVLEYLVKNHSKKDYWLQLSGIYGELDKPEEQTITMELAYQQGLLTKSNEIMNLSQLLMQQDIPYRAATILKKGLSDGIVKKDEKSLRVLSQAYRLAQEEEKSIPPLKESAKMSGDAEVYLQIAYAYSNLYNWEETEKYCKKALSIGGLKRADSANVVLGMAYFNNKKLHAAKKAFREAQKDKRSKRNATQWLRYLDKEIEREEMLAASL